MMPERTANVIMIGVKKFQLLQENTKKKQLSLIQSQYSHRLIMCIYDNLDVINVASYVKQIQFQIAELI